MSGPAFILAALEDGQVVTAPVGTPLDLDAPGWRRPVRDQAAQLAAAWPGPAGPADPFEALPGITAASVVLLLADGTSHRFLIEAPEGAATRIDHDPATWLPDFDLGPAPPVVTRAYPWQIGFAFALPPAAGSRVTYSVPGAGPPAQNPARAVMERQAILNRLRDRAADWETEAGEIDVGPGDPGTWAAARTLRQCAAAVVAALDDPDPLGHP